MIDKGIKFVEKHQKCILGGVLVLIALSFGITRLWQLNILPFGMHMDEAGMAYDAWCLATYGVDRWLKSWPVYMTNFYSGQSSMYAFLCAGLFWVFGYSIWLVRLPAVLFSLFTLVFGMKLARYIYPDDTFLSWLLGLLVTFCPYFVMSGRLALDCNLMLGMSTVFLYMLATAIDTGKYWRYVVCGLAGGLLLYTYALTYLILPLFLLLVLIYVIVVRKFSFDKWLLMAIPLGLLATPLIMVQIVNYFDLPEMKLGIFTITKLPGYRVSEIGSFQLEKLGVALRSIFVGDGYTFDSIPGIWNLYAITVVLFVVGFASTLIQVIRMLRKRKLTLYALPLFWFLVILMIESHISTNSYRINGIFLVVALMAVEGVHAVKCFLRIKEIKWFPVVLACLCGIYAVCVLRFGVFYFSGRYTEATYPITYFGYPFPEGAEYIENHQFLKDKVTYVSEQGIYYAISAMVPPWEFDITGDASGLWKNYWFASLPEISGEFNYLVRDGFVEYCDELRQEGFTEVRFENYSLFYMEP